MTAMHASTSGFRWRCAGWSAQAFSRLAQAVAIAIGVVAGANQLAAAAGSAVARDARAVAPASAKKAANSTSDERWRAVAVDIAQLTGPPVVLRAADGGVFVAFPQSPAREIFFGHGKELYLQINLNGGRTGQAWTQTFFSPRVRDGNGASLDYKSDGRYVAYCGNDTLYDGLTVLSGDEASNVLRDHTFWTSATVRQPMALGRDNAGNYYYVDHLRKIERAKQTEGDYRVFFGKRGALRLLPLRDVALDDKGAVFSTKNGELRMVIGQGEDASVTWIARGKQNKLVVLDLFTNAYLIYRDLRLYTFLGTPCDHL